MNTNEQLILELTRILLKPVINAVGGAESPEQIEAERQAMILAQRTIQEAIAKKVVRDGAPMLPIGTDLYILGGWDPANLSWPNDTTTP